MMRTTSRPSRSQEMTEPARLVPWSTGMPSTALSTAESLLIVTTRLWVQARSQETPTPWYAGLAAAGLADDGIPDFDMMMKLVASGAVRPLDVAHPQRRCVGACEISLLDIVARLQRDECGGAIELMGGWLAFNYVVPAMRYARSVAANMRAVRLLVPRRTRLG